MMIRRAFGAILVSVLAGVTPAAAGGKARGTATAAITIQLFSDFQCPACKALHEETVQPLIREYVNTGRVYLVNRDFPLPAHQYARPAALLATAAARIGKYELVADELFAKQQLWSATGKVEETALAVLTPAEAKRVKALAATPEIAAEVDKDIQAGKAENLTQTPTMIVMHNGRKYPVAGVVSFAILKRFLDQTLGSK